MEDRKILWVDLQPSMYCLFKRTAQRLSKHFEVKRWAFEHDPDESCDVDIVHSLLRQTIKSSSSPVHLIGHGLSGTIACLYAQKYPKRIASVTLLSVDIKSTNQWTSHYQSMRSQLPCSRYHILSHLGRLLVDNKTEQIQNVIAKLLARCLDNDFVQGSIIKDQTISNLSKINSPVLVINGGKDFVIDDQSHERWKYHLKPGDCYQRIDNGRHFFPFTEWSQTANMIESFINMVPDQKHNLIPDCYKNLSSGKTNS